MEINIDDEKMAMEILNGLSAQYKHIVTTLDGFEETAPASWFRTSSVLCKLP